MSPPLSALQEAHRLLTALMVERVGGPRIEGSQIAEGVLQEARELPLIGCFVDEAADALVVDFDDRAQDEEPEHRQTLQRMLGDLPVRLRYGRNEDQGLEPRRSEP